MLSRFLRAKTRWIRHVFSGTRTQKSPSRNLRRALLKLECLEDRLAPSTVVLGQQAGAPNQTQFHITSAGAGFDQNETTLTPSNVASSFGQLWQSPVLDGAIYATPLSVDSLLIQDAVSGVNGNLSNHAGDGIQSSSFVGNSLGVVFAATGGGSVYAIAEADTNGPTGIAPGTILWKTHLGNPYAGIDGNSIGVLSTPVIDLASGRLYVTASVTDYLSSPSNPNHGGNNFEVFALNLSDGSLVAGYPLIYTQSLLDSINQNNLATTSASISSATVSSGVVTITTNGSNSLSSGQTVIIAGVGNGYDGTYAITGVNAGADTFTYADANATGAVANSGTASGKVAVVFSSSGADQRGALRLSADGSILYVDFACYGSSNGGWMTTVATGVTNGVSNSQTPAIVSAYSSIDTTAVIANGGMWGAGGPVIDANGNVFVTTGDAPPGTGNPLGTWGNSVLEWGPGQTLTLTGVYTPWNYPNQDTIDSDMGGGSPILLTLPAGSSTTTELLATGGKQGNGYLVDAGNNLNNPTPNPNGSPASYPASLTQRPPNTESPDQDASLYEQGSAGIRTYWTTNNQGQSVSPQDGPLALFGPYNESSASGNTAKARDTPATFTGPDGNQYIIWAGATKTGVGSSTPEAPSLIETEVVHTAGQPAYLQIVAQNTAVMANPGSNMITGNGTSNEIDWVVDEGAQRNDGDTSYSDGGPVLYAYNALTLQPLWSSAYEELAVPWGKYNSIAVAHGEVLVQTNRIQAFGLTSNTIVDDSVTGAGMNQFNYVGSGWTHVTGSSTIGAFDGTVSTDNVQGDFATMTFTGSAINVYANELTTYGTATFSIDGGNTQTVTLRPANSSANGAGAGDVLVYTVSGLSAGTHTFEILNNAASNIISIDRVQITPLATTHADLSISLTDGGQIPSGGGAVIPYTINYDNAGSIVNSTGVAATGVTLTETVQANTTADLANSTPGWTLVSGNGGAGSIYTFTVGNLGAGVNGSVVFSVDLNSSIPTGTTTVSNNVSISDAASDVASATRSTPIPPPAESKLIFSQEPPANGSAGIALSPAVTVSVEDQFGNVYTADSASTVTLTLNGGTFSGGGDTATATASNGVATFNNLIITASGNYTLTATDGMLASTNSSSFFIANSAKLGFMQQPTQSTAGAVISPSVTVAVENQSGTVITTDTSTVILTINHGSFANGSTTVSAQASSGVATFNNLVIDATGSYTLVATDGGLQQAQSNSFNIVAVASQLVITQQPNNTYAGEAVNPSVAVSLEDGFGNVATGNTDNVTVTLNGGTFFGGGATATVGAINGVASFNNLVITTPATYTLTASDASNGSLSSVTSYSFTIGSHALTTIDDNNANNTGSTPKVVYAGGWTQAPTFLPNNTDGTVTSDNLGGDSATVTFTGTLITLYAVESPTAGAVQVFIDGNNPAEINLASPTTMIAPVFTSPLLSAGTHTIDVSIASGNVSIDDFIVGPATPTLAWATPANLVFGTALTGTELDAFVSNFANFPGTFTYTPAAGTTLHVGPNQPLTVKFVPQDSADYATANAEVLINVQQATPLITWTGPNTDMTFGQALSSAQLNATATVNGMPVQGNFVYTPGIGTVPPTGADFPLSVTFTPTDTTDYTSVTAIQNVDVDPATPVITWNNPADITDGTPLGATQLDASANVPGTFVYTPATGTVLPVGQNQSLGVFFIPNDSTDYNTVGASATINIDYGPAAKLVFIQQPTGTSSGTDIAPPVTVAVEDSNGTTLLGDSSNVTLTISSGTFVGGGTTATAQPVNGVATFSSLAIANNGAYSFTATDGSLTSAVSNTFNIGANAYVNFNSGATTLTSQFNKNNNTGSDEISWSATAGIDDNTGGTAGGGVSIAKVGTDETAIYTPVTFNLADDNVHTVSIFVTAAGGLNSGDRNQIGFIIGSTGLSGEFNGGSTYISARIYGNDTVQFQYDNGTSAATNIGSPTSATGTITTGDWLQFVFSAQETASGSFTLTMSLLDYGPTGTTTPTIVTAPVTANVTGMTAIGTGASMYAGFRTATGGEFTTPLSFDNFAVDQPPAKMAYLSQPTVGIAGVAMSPFVAAVEDINANIVAGNIDPVTLTLSHGTFSNGLSSVTVNAVDGIATFSSLVITTPGSYVLKATDANNPNLDPGFAPFTIAVVPAMTTQPTNFTVNAGGTATFTAAASGSPTPTVQWQVNSGSGFTNLTDGPVNGAVYSGSATGTLTITGATAAMNTYQYQAVFTNVGGTITSSPATLTVDFAPTITTQPSSHTVASGATTFTAAATSNPSPATVQWQISTNGGVTFTPLSNSGVYSTVTTPTLNISNVSGLNGNLYRAVFTNSVGSTNTAAATLTITNAPDVTTQPTNQAVIAGSNITFTAKATASGTMTVTWRIISATGNVTTLTNGGLYSWGATVASGATDTLTITGATSALNGNMYDAVFTLNTNSAPSGAATLTVDTAPAVTTQPTNQTANAGTTATFTAAASGNPAPTVQWQVSTNGGTNYLPISGATSTTLTLSGVSFSQNGYMYEAVFTNSVNSATSNPATLTVDTAPALTTQPVNQTAVAGATATFTAAASGNPAPTVQWQVSTNGGTSFSPINGATSTTLSLSGVTVSQNGDEFEAVFTNSVTSVTTSAATLNIAPSLAGLPVVNGSNAVINIVSATGDGTTATITTSAQHGFWVGELVTLTGTSPAGPGGLAGTVTVTGVPSATTFQFVSTYSGSESLSGATVKAALAGVQRSMVDSIVYNFNEPVNLTAAAFAINVVVDNTSTGDKVGVAPTLNVAPVPFTNEWVVTFTDPVNGSVFGNSIANGAYSISINSAMVTSVTGGQNLSAGETDTFYRLYGDVTGVQSVKNVDANAFNRAWGNFYYSANYNAALDYNDDGKYTNIDANAFNRAFNTRYQITTTI